MVGGHTVPDLLNNARRGDDAALGRLLSMYNAYLLLLARLQIDTSLRGKVTPSDVVQDTFLDAKRGFAGFRGQSERELIGWLRRILANQMADAVRHFRTDKRDVRLEVHLDVQLTESSQRLENSLVADVESPSDSIARREAAVLLADSLDRLTRDYREVLILRHLEDQSFDEVARAMGRSLDSVKNLWARAIAKLRVLMEE